MTETLTTPSSTPAPEWDAEITLAEAARLSGRSPKTIQGAAATGALRVKRHSPKVVMTTRQWLDDMLRAQARLAGPGRPPKPLPADYQSPPREGPDPPTATAHNDRHRAMQERTTDEPDDNNDDPHQNHVHLGGRHRQAGPLGAR